MIPPTRRLPSLTALAAFEALLRRGSIKAAADELAVSPQAVSHHVKMLESQVNAELIRYRDREWHLTPAGEACAATLRGAFEGLRLAVRHMRENTERPSLKVSIDPALASTWLVPRLSGFHAEGGEIDVLLDATVRVVDVAAGEADVAVRYGRGDYSGVIAWRLFDDHVYPVCSPALRDGERPLRDPDDLAAHTLIHLDWQPAQGRWPRWQDWLGAAGVTAVDFGRGIQFTDHALALHAAAAGQGIALGSSPLTQDSRAAGLLVQPFATELDTGFGYDVIIRPDDRSGPAGAFAEWIRHEAAPS